MDSPSKQDITKLGRYFAIECNNNFWQLSEQENNKEQKKQILTNAFASLYHWDIVGNDENRHLAYLAVARALTINSIAPLATDYATQAYDYFKPGKEKWIRAFTAAILSHALLISGEVNKATEYYSEASSIADQLDPEDRDIFDATFQLIPDPQA